MHDTPKFTAPGQNEPPSPNTELSAEDASTVAQLQDGLKLLERIEPAYTPLLAWFEANVAEAKRKRRSRILRDLAVLWSIGLVLLSGLFLLMYRAPAAFIALQGAAALAPLLLLLSKRTTKGTDNRHGYE